MPSVRTPASIPGALARFTEQWQPHLLTTVNDQDVKIARIQGEFIWHAHPDSDELFLVVSGELTIQLRDRDVLVGPSEIFVVPAGVEHCPTAEQETVIVMVEKVGTVNTGDAGGERTAELRELPPDVG
jgi:mannose-6-phosphate isomerase-like protein (cupin superfamily)